MLTVPTFFRTCVGSSGATVGSGVGATACANADTGLLMRTTRFTPSPSTFRVASL